MPIDFEFIRHCKARNNTGLTICQPKKKNLAKGQILALRVIARGI
jgi:hypothetical protein